MAGILGVDDLTSFLPKGGDSLVMNPLFDSANPRGLSGAKIADEQKVLTESIFATKAENERSKAGSEEAIATVRPQATSNQVLQNEILFGKQEAKVMDVTDLTNTINNFVTNQTGNTSSTAGVTSKGMDTPTAMDALAKNRELRNQAMKVSEETMVDHAGRNLREEWTNSVFAAQEAQQQYTDTMGSQLNQGVIAFVQAFTGVDISAGVRAKLNSAMEKEQMLRSAVSNQANTTFNAMRFFDNLQNDKIYQNSDTSSLDPNSKLAKDRTSYYAEALVALKARGELNIDLTPDNLIGKTQSMMDYLFTGANEAEWGSTARVVVDYLKGQQFSDRLDPSSSFSNAMMYGSQYDPESPQAVEALTFQLNALRSFETYVQSLEKGERNRIKGLQASSDPQEQAAFAKVVDKYLYDRNVQVESTGYGSMIATGEVLTESITETLNRIKSATPETYENIPPVIREYINNRGTLSSKDLAKWSGMFLEDMRTAVQMSLQDVPANERQEYIKAHSDAINMIFQSNYEIAKKLNVNSIVPVGKFPYKFQVVGSRALREVDGRVQAPAYDFTNPAHTHAFLGMPDLKYGGGF